MVGQRALDTDPQEQAVSDVEAGAGDDLPVGQLVLAGEDLQLQHEYAIQRGAPETSVSLFPQGPKGLEVDAMEPAQEMVFGHEFLVQLTFVRRQRDQLVRC